MEQTATYQEFFQKLTGFTPNPFQQRVADALLNERSVVLRAPTGSGKTWAVVAPFLYALRTGNPIADRLLYALPLRSLATSLYDSTSEAAMKCDTTKSISDRIRIQTGERRDDPLFEGRITFTTIDQLLSSYLIQPVGLPTRLGNINAGAIFGALVCFDEFHLLEPARSMATALEMLETLAVKYPLSRFVLMTATLADQTLDWLTKKLKAVFIDVPAAEVANLPNELGKQRCYRWVEEPLSARAVTDVHAGRRSIVIANSVSRAQELYEELISPECRALLGDKTQVRLLHSRFFTRDRQRIEANLASWFGPKPTVADVILVSTQVVEAGLDFSCDNLHTEVAPMNAIVQRAGRCARRPGETGTVWCYALGVNRKGEPAYGAYTEVASLIDGTTKALREAVSAEPQRLVFHDELKLVNHVHTEWELQQLKPFENLNSRRKEVRMAMDGDNREAVRQLVRDVSSINVVITDRPENLNFNGREWPEMLSVPPTSLYKLFSNELPPTNDWIAKSACEQDVVQGGSIEMKWEPLQQSKDLARAGWLIAIHPSRATYDSERGLIVGRSGPPQPVLPRVRQAATRYSYKKEEYAEHIRRVRAAGDRRDSENHVAARRLTESLRLAPDQLARWLDLIYLLHDIGKLSVDWQAAVWAWQMGKTGPASDPRPPLAHTDFNPEIDYGKHAPRRTPHAAEGAYAAQQLLLNAFAETSDESLVLAALTAIVRHHGAFTADLSSFRLIHNSAAFVAETFGCDPCQLPLMDNPDPVALKEFRTELLTATSPSFADALPLYFYFVRRLRIADQNSFQEN